MLVVVLIIALTSAIAIPGIVNRMKSNRTKMAAERMAIHFRQARLRAIGRSGATLVRFNGGNVEVKEAIQGPDAVAPGCARLPATACNDRINRWDSPRSQRVDASNFGATPEFDINLLDSGDNPRTFYDVCFSPSGRTWARINSTYQFVPWTDSLRITVDRVDGIGFQRSVVVSPTGAARVVATP